MSSDVVGLIFRRLQRILDRAASQFSGQADKLAKDIGKKLTGNTKTDFNNGYGNATSTQAKLRAAMKALRRVVRMIDQLGEFVSKTLLDAERELRTLIDLLRALEALEADAKAFDDLAKAYGH